MLIIHSRGLRRPMHNRVYIHGLLPNLVCAHNLLQQHCRRLTMALYCVYAIYTTNKLWFTGAISPNEISTCAFTTRRKKATLFATLYSIVMLNNPSIKPALLRLLNKINLVSYFISRPFSKLNFFSIYLYPFRKNFYSQAWKI